MDVVEQAMHYERALRLAREKRAGEEIDAEVAKFETLSTLFDSEIQRATEGLERSLARVTAIPDAIALARIQPILPLVGKEHLAYHDRALKLIDGARALLPEAQINLSDDVARQEDEMDTILAEAATAVGEFVERQGHLVRKHQERRSLVMAESLGITLLTFLVGLSLAVVITRRIV